MIIPLLFLFATILTVHGGGPSPLSCQGVTMSDQPVWPLNECITFSGESQQFFCDQSSSSGIRVERYNESGCPGHAFQEESDVNNVTAHGCGASDTCSLARIDEYLNSSYSGTCTPNHDGLHITAAIALDQCFYDSPQETYVQLTCVRDETAGFGYTLTYTEYSDDTCQTETRSSSISDRGCLDITVSPYIDSLQCDLPIIPDMLSCRGVTMQSQPIWPLDECITFSEGSQQFYCDGGGVKVRRYNASSCPDDELTSEEYVEDVTAHGCYSYTICGMARVDEYLNSSYSGTCTPNTAENHIIAPVALDQCWYDEQQEAHVRITCAQDDTAGFGYTLTYTEYYDACETEKSVTSISEPGCLDIIVSPYFNALTCEEAIEPEQLSCRGVTMPEQPIWPLEECISFVGGHAEGRGQSQEFYCDYGSVRVRRYNATGCPQDEFMEDQFVDSVTAHGCYSRKPCGIARVDERLNSSYTGTCVANQYSMRVMAGIALDQCWWDQPQDAYVQVSCVEDDNDAGFGYTLTYKQYSDASCETETQSTSISAEGCLDIAVSPYFTALECDLPSEVYETECRSVSENNNVVWPLEECIGTAKGGYAESSMYYCDDNNELYRQRWDNFDCSGDSSSTDIPTNVNGHGCERSTVCETFVVDEYLNSTYTGTCEKDTDQIHVNAAIVLDTCWKDEKGVYAKVTCEEDEQAAFGYTVTYREYPETGCQGTPVESSISGEGCLDIEVAPYFTSLECNFRSPVYETECRSVSENNNIVWPLDQCVGTSQLKDGVREESSFKYQCDDDGNVYRQKWTDSFDCEGENSETDIARGVNADGCDRYKICNTIHITEYLNSNQNNVCSMNDAGEDNLKIEADIVVDTCWKDQQGVYNKITCEKTPDTTFGNTLTFQQFTEPGCEGTPSYEEALGEPGCLGIPEAPYFTDIQCNPRSPVYETDCRSVSENNNIVWPLDECIGTSQIRDGTREYASFMYRCDDDDEVYREIYKESSSCDGASERVLPIGVNAHGCARSKPCNTIQLDEWINSKVDGVCSKNEDGEDNLNIVAGIVLDTCIVQDGEYFKITCAETESTAFGYTVTYENYTEAGCMGTADYVATLGESGCLNVHGSPYFDSMECNFRTPVYEESCRSVSENNGIVWPLDRCITMSRTDPVSEDVESTSFKYECDANNDILQFVWEGMEDCSGTATGEGRPKNINGHGCDRTEECDVAIFDEYLNSYENEECNQNLNGEDNQRIQGAIVLNTCVAQDGEYFKVGCIENDGEFGYKVVYTNYTNADCVDEAYQTDISGPGCLAIDVSPYFADLECIGAETTTTQPPETTDSSETTTQVVVDTGKGCVVQISLFIYCLVFFIMYISV